MIPAGSGFLAGSVLTVDGARDNWAGPWPPGNLVSLALAPAGPVAARQLVRVPPSTGRRIPVT